MSRGDGNQKSGDEFQEAMKDVRRISESRSSHRKRPATKKRVAASRSSKEYRFKIESYGEQVEALLVGEDRKKLRALRRGDFPPESEFDLHGLREGQAETRTRNVLKEAFDGGLRSVLLIHGRGHHSPVRAVLKSAIPEWLTSQPTAEIVLAFCTAPIELGAGGATLVLLRRNRAAV